MGHNLEAETATEDVVEEAIDKASGEIPEENAETTDEGVEAPEPTGEDAIAVAEMATLAVVRGICAIKKIRVTEQVTRLCRLSESEKDEMRPYAPFAAPYLRYMASKSDMVMAVIFAGIFGSKITSRLRTLNGVQMSQEAEVTPSQSSDNFGKWDAQSQPSENPS